MADFLEPIKVAGRIGHIARLLDGRLISLYTLGREEYWEAGPPQACYLRYSDDYGATWSEEETAFHYPEGRGTFPRYSQSQGPQVLVDGKGGIHVFALRMYQSPVKGDRASVPVSRLCHTVSRDGGKSWSAPRAIETGYFFVAAMEDSLRLRSGRLILSMNGFCDHYVPEKGEFENRCLTVFADGSGDIWKVGAADLGVPLGSFVGHPGAIEPVLVETADRGVRMLIRTQLGVFYESFSTDGGEEWSLPSPTAIGCVNAPCAILGLRDGRQVLCWNDPASYPGGLVLRSGRQYLHLALSHDDGRTWSRPRLVAGPLASAPANSQVRYPFLCESDDGFILLRYHRIEGEIQRRELLRVAPDGL